MGRIAELFEKKALGTLSEAETKELKALLAEAKAAEGNDGGDEEDTEDEDVGADVDKAAQKFADIFQAKLDKNEEVIKGVLAEMKAAGAPVSEVNRDTKYFVNKELGERNVKELREMKVSVPGRESKKFKEVSMQTVEFLKAFFNNDVQKLQILTDSTTDSGAGGYLIPQEYANMIIEDRRDANIMRQLAAPAITIKGATFNLPNLASRPKAQWVAEKAAKNTSTAQFGNTAFTPNALAVIVPLTNQLVADAQIGVDGSVLNYIAGLMAVSLAEAEEKAFWTGSGTGQPKGVTAYTPGHTVTSTDVTDVARADAIIAGKIRTGQGYRQRASWVGNQETYENVQQLKDSNNRLLLNLDNSLVQETSTLVGRPTYESNYLPGGELWFGDWSYYQIVDREGISIKISDEAVVAGVSAFEKNLTYIRAEERTDGQLVLPAAVTKVAGLGTP